MMMNTGSMFWGYLRLCIFIMKEIEWESYSLIKGFKRNSSREWIKKIFKRYILIRDNGIIWKKLI